VDLAWAALISAVIPALVGLYLSRRVSEVHVLVNSKHSAALARIADLETQLARIAAAAALKDL